MVFVEAMSCGAPVIGAKSGGPLDFVSPAVGELVPEADSTDELSVSLKDAILRAVNEDWRTAKESACIKLVDTEYSAKRQCTELLANAKRMLKQQ
jgi:glycosyltransferase involved in cell wall biosynthesis